MTSKIKSKHPRAGQTMTGAEMVLEVLAEEGVDVIFGYSGGAVLPTYDAVFKYNEANRKKEDEDPIQLVVPANEQGAGFMAAGYAKSSGKVGCFLVTSGPGATNCVTPVRDCMADSIPVVMLSGQVPTAAMGTDAFQEAPIYNIMTPCAKHVFLVSKPEVLEASIRTAFRVARNGRPGPVVIDLPKDVQNWVGVFKGEGELYFKGYEERQKCLRESRIDEVAAGGFYDLLAKSKRPLIYAGGGIIASEAAEALLAFAEHFNIPAVNTLLGIGTMPPKHDLTLGMLGMHGSAFANYAVEDCDFLIAVGSRFDDRVAGKVLAFAPNAKAIAHIDIDKAEISKVKRADWSHVGDARVALDDLLECGKSLGVKGCFDDWVAHCMALKKKYAFDYDHDADVIQPYTVLEMVAKATGGDAIITTGVGQHQMWAAQYCTVSGPRLFLTSGSMGTMGFGLPAAIGASFANPDKTVIDVDGDGSIRMNFGDLETIVTYGLKTKVLLLNNLGDGMVRQWQRTYFGNRFSGTDKTLHTKNFTMAAKADGFLFAESVSDKTKLKDVVDKFVNYDGPAFLEVMIDREADVMPMVGPGTGYKEMITGPHIAHRNYEANNDEVAPDLF